MKFRFRCGQHLVVAGAVVCLSLASGSAEDFYWLWQTTNPAAALARTSMVVGAGNASTELVVRVVEALRASGEAAGDRDHMQLLAENLDLKKKLERAIEEAGKAGDAAAERAKLQSVIRSLEATVAELTEKAQAAEEESAEIEVVLEAKWRGSEGEVRWLADENALIKERNELLKAENERLRDELTELLGAVCEEWDCEVPVPAAFSQTVSQVVSPVVSQDVQRVVIVSAASNEQPHVEQKAGVTGGVAAADGKRVEGKGLAAEPVRALSPKEARDLHYQKAQAHAVAGRLKEAELEYSAILKLDPSDADVHYALGSLYGEGMKDARRAAPHYRRYLQLMPAGSEAEAVKKRLKAADPR